eukprot:10358995-Heterocapsa_arctica.AAC.1
MSRPAKQCMRWAAVPVNLGTSSMAGLHNCTGHPRSMDITCLELPEEASVTQRCARTWPAPMWQMPAKTSANS